MSSETRIGEGAHWDLPLDLDPIPPTGSPPKLKPKAPKDVPVARPVGKAPAVRTGPETPEETSLLTPSSLRGWGGSVGLHILLLLVLGLWIFQVQSNPARVIETSLAGSPLGSELGDSLTGGLGLETPLAMPEGPGQALENTTLTVLPPVTALTLDPSTAAANRSASAKNASNGGGLNLSNPGQAGSGDGFGVARFGTGTERVKGIEVKVGDPQFTLIWEGQGDLDLHVQEPGGSHIYWPPEYRHGEQGGELDVDNRYGPGPENIYWAQGEGPKGTYKWYVEYFGPAPLESYTGPLRWVVRIKHKGKLNVFKGELKQIGDRSRTYTLAVGEKD